MQLVNYCTITGIYHTASRICKISVGFQIFDALGVVTKKQLVIIL